MNINTTPPLTKTCNICCGSFETTHGAVNVCRSCGSTLLYYDQETIRSAAGMGRTEAQGAVILDHEIRENYGSDFLAAAPGLFLVTYDLDEQCFDEEPILAWLVSRIEDRPSIPVTPGGAWHNIRSFGIVYPDGRMFCPPAVGMHSREEGLRLVCSMALGA